mgnify:CR=1 FL=1
MYKTYAKQRQAWRTKRVVGLPHGLAAAVISLSLTLPVAAGPREQAKRIHDRLTGVPPTAAVLDLMEDEIDSGAGPVAAARIAMDLSLIHISEPTRPSKSSRMPSSA